MRAKLYQKFLSTFLACTLGFIPVLQNFAYAAEHENNLEAFNDSSTHMGCLSPEFLENHEIVPFEYETTENSNVSTSLENFLEENGDATLLVDDQSVTFYAEVDFCVQEIKIEKGNAEKIWDGFVFRLNQMYGEEFFKTVLKNLGFAAVGAGAGIGLAALQATPVGWVADIIVVGFLAYWIGSNLWTCIELYSDDNFEAIGSHLAVELNALVFSGLGFKVGSSQSVVKLFSSKIIGIKQWASDFSLPSWFDFSSSPKPSPKLTSNIFPKDGTTLTPDLGGTVVGYVANVEAGAAAQTGGSSASLFSGNTGGSQVAVAQPIPQLRSAQYKKAAALEINHAIQNPIIKIPQKKTVVATGKPTKTVFFPLVLNEHEKNKSRIQMTTEEPKSDQSLLQEALNGEINFRHLDILKRAKKTCLENSNWLVTAVCQKIIGRVNFIEAAQKRYIEFGQFPIDPAGFIQWWKKLKFVRNSSGVIKKNPFTKNEIKKISEEFKKDMYAAAKSDGFANSNIPHMEEHLEHVNMFSTIIQLMDIDITYYGLLVLVHDAGKFMPSQRVLEAAKKKGDQSFLYGRVVWHDQSTVEYLLKLGERLSVAPEKIEHLIADIIGHNDGSGLKGIFWTYHYPEYGVPLRLEGDMLALFDRYGQGNYIGAKKIAPTSPEKGFLGKIRDAYLISPQNTIRQLEVIHNRAAARLKTMMFSEVDLKVALSNLNIIFKYAADAQKPTMQAYKKLKWSEADQSFSFDYKGKRYVAHNMNEFLSDEFQTALKKLPPSLKK